MEHFHYILVLLCCSVVFIWTCRRLHLPPVIGYLLVGIIVGPGGLGWLPTLEDMHLLAEFGVVFLMFTLGLEFSIPRLMATKKVLFGIGGAQVLSCTLIGMLICFLFNISLRESFILGGALALSSTAIVVKQLAEQKERHAIHGEMAINILLFQDLAAVCFLVLIPALSFANDDNVYVTFALTVAKGAAAIFGLAIFGLWILRPLFRLVARMQSTELFMLTTLLVSLSAAALTYVIGLSLALGSFMAGLVLGETEFKNQIELDIRPFKDVLLGLFFVVIGAFLKLNTLHTIWLEIILIVIALIVIKFVFIMFVAKFFANLTIEDAVRVGIALAHGGEFSFVLLREGIDSNVISGSWQPILFASIVISALISPIMLRYNSKLSNILCFKKTQKKPHSPYATLHLKEQTQDLEQHVILCGYGRVGQILARFLDEENIPWLALDLDPMRVSKAAVGGERSFYGDATRSEILAAAGIAKARMLVVSFDSERSALDVLLQARNMRLDLPIFIRTRDDKNLEEFQKAGATEVVPESLEGSIMLATHLLITLGVPTQNIVTKLKKVHTNRYENLKDFYYGVDEPKTLEDQEPNRKSLHSLFIPHGAQIIGNNVGYLIAPTPDVMVKIAIRKEQRVKLPEQSFVLQENDVLVISASSEEVAILEERILLG